MGQEKAQQTRRRLTRRVEEVATVLQSLLPPGGPAAESTVQHLDHLVRSGSPIDWHTVPPSCDPITIIAAGSKVAVEALDEATRLRADRKRWQVESFYLLLKLLVSSDKPHHIVDFGCGTGNLLLPLASLLPHCTFTGVEMKPAATGLLQQRADEAGLTNVRTFTGMIEQYDEPFDVALALHACGNATDHVLLKAVAQQAAYLVSPCCVGKLKFSMAGGSSFHKSVTTWFPQMPGDRPCDRPKHHLQQEQRSSWGLQQQQAPAQQASEQEQAAAGQQQQQQGDASAPGTSAAPAQQQQPSRKRPLEQDGAEGDAADTANGSAAGQQAGKLQHPRSQWLMAGLQQPERHFKLIAQIADVHHSQSELAQLTSELAIQRAAIAGTCKLHVELDRNEAAREAGYHVALSKVLQHSQMAKNDLLVGVPGSWSSLGALQQALRLS